MTDNLKETGECPVCRGDYRLTKAGKVWRHGAYNGARKAWPPRDCDGKGADPVRTQALTEETR